MNQRIQALAEQANQYANEKNEKYGVDFNTEFESKFAELIIRECVEYYCSQIGKTSEPHTKTLEHFGVEE